MSCLICDMSSVTSQMSYVMYHKKRVIGGSVINRVTPSSFWSSRACQHEATCSGHLFSVFLLFKVEVKMLRSDWAASLVLSVTRSHFHVSSLLPTGIQIQDPLLSIRTGLLVTPTWYQGPELTKVGVRDAYLGSPLISNFFNKERPTKTIDPQYTGVSAAQLSFNLEQKNI